MKPLYRRLSLAGLAVMSALGTNAAPDVCAVRSERPANPFGLTESLAEMPASYGEFFRTSVTATPVPSAPPALRGPVQAPAGPDGDIYGYLFYYQGESLEQGFYRISPDSAAAQHLWTDAYTDWGMTMNHGWLRDGKLCGLNTLKFMGGIYAYAYMEFDFETGEVLGMDQIYIDSLDMSNIFLTTAYNELDDYVYGYGYSPDSMGFAFSRCPATDFSKAEVIRLADKAEVCTALCYNAADDLLYGVTTSGTFVSIDREGTQHVLMDLNVDGLATFISGLVYRPDTDSYMWNAYFADYSSAMYDIQPARRKRTKLYDCTYGEEYIYMIDTLDNVSPAAPAQPVVASVDFAGTSLSGSVSFAMPGVTYAGDPLSGQLEWSVLVDGAVVNSGSAAPSEAVTAEIPALTNASHVIAVTASAGGLRSLPAIHKRWIGADTPCVPGGLKLTETLLSWDAVSSTLHGGYADYGDIVYTVRLNDTPLGQTRDTQMAIELPEGLPYNSYTAYVTAAFDGHTSDEAVSNYIRHGLPLVPDPAIHYRPEEKDFELFTPFNADGHKDEEGNDVTWRFDEGYMGFPAFMSGYNGDDWLFFPPMLFDNAEKAYKFTVEVGLVHDSDNTGRFSVYIGKSPDMESMTHAIIPPHQCNYMRPEVISEYFAVSEPGVYYIGMHAVTHQVSFHVSDMDVALTDKTANVPAAVTDLGATAAADGSLRATVTFTMPTLLANGSPIADDADLTAIVTARSNIPGSADPGEVSETLTVSGSPGSAQCVEIATSQNYNMISVACALDGITGAETSMRLYTGRVRPYIVQDLTSKVSEDNLSMTLSWTPPVEGEEPGEIGDDFLYTIWYYNNGWEFGDTAGWNELSYTYTLREGADLQWVRLGVMAYNDAGQSDHVTSVTDIIGTPYTLPMVETFPDYMDTYEPVMVLRPSDEYADTYWMVDDPASLSPLFSNGSGIAYIGFTEGRSNVKSRLSLPKFSTLGLDDVEFTLNYFGGYNNAYAAQMHLLANVYDMEVPAAVADFAKGDLWLTQSVALPDFATDREWVELYIDADFANDQEFAMFSGYSITAASSVGRVADTEGRISTGGGMLHVSGFAGQPLRVTDLWGATVLSVASLDVANGYALPRGAYIVTAGSTTRKVIL